MLHAGGAGVIQDSQQLQSGLRLAAELQKLINRGSSPAAVPKAAVLREADVMALITACSRSRRSNGVTAELLLDLLLCLPPLSRVRIAGLYCAASMRAGRQ